MVSGFCSASGTRLGTVVRHENHDMGIMLDVSMGKLIQITFIKHAVLLHYQWAGMSAKDSSSH
jgi:hypothetical protein